jgi:hypothetical protein
MGEAETTAANSEAQRMIDTFTSVGATRFDVTRTNAADDKVSFERSMSRSELARTLPAMFDIRLAPSQCDYTPHWPQRQLFAARRRAAR